MLGMRCCCHSPIKGMYCGCESTSSQQVSIDWAPHSQTATGDTYFERVDIGVVCRCHNEMLLCLGFCFHILLQALQKLLQAVQHARSNI